MGGYAVAKMAGYGQTDHVSGSSASSTPWHGMAWHGTSRAGKRASFLPILLNCNTVVNTVAVISFDCLDAPLVLPHTVQLTNTHLSFYATAGHTAGVPCILLYRVHFCAIFYVVYCCPAVHCIYAVHCRCGVHFCALYLRCVLLYTILTAAVHYNHKTLCAQLVSMASAVCCIGGIGGLSSQSTARLGNVLGMSGVAFGVAATVGTLAPGAAQMAQLATLMGVGGVGGYQVRSRALFCSPNVRPFCYQVHSRPFVFAALLPFFSRRVWLLYTPLFCHFHTFFAALVLFDLVYFWLVLVLALFLESGVFAFSCSRGRFVTCILFRRGLTID